MSARSADCPTHDTLQRLLTGGPTDPPPALLYAHIEQCNACIRTLFDLGQADTFRDFGGGPEDDSPATRAGEPYAPPLQDLPAGPTAAPPGDPSGVDAAVRALLSPPQAADEIGRLGTYRVFALLGYAGMGAVFQAEDPRLGRRVALKVMLPQVAARADMKGRFLREARAAAALEHDHVVPVFEVNEANGVPYIAMQLLQGETLSDHLARHPGPRPAAEVVRVGREVAAGLAAAHARGLIHRDIKPANLWLDAAAGGRVKILDFGLARVEADGQVTATGAVLGTPAFMAPEQASGEAVDHRADLFSLGVVLYRLSTGVLPFGGKSALAVLAALARPPRPVRELNPDVPPRLADLIRRLLAHAPADRPASAESVAAELAAVLDPTAAVPRRRRWLVPVAVVAAALLAAGIGFAAYKLSVETKDGTLVLDVDPEADVRFKGGAVQVYDDKGELRYTLTASEKNKTLPSGKYRVKVVGADGLTLDAEQFDFGKEGKKVRVRADPPKADPPKADPPKADPRTAPDVRSETAFPGKLVFRDTFESAETCRLPLGDGPPRREVKGGKYVATSGEVKAGESVLVEVGPGAGVGAFAGKVRAEGGDLVVNVRARNDGKQARWLAVRVTQAGGWAVLARRHDYEDGKWVPKADAALAASTEDDAALVAGKWVTVAARWTEVGYEVWLNGKRVADGAADKLDGKPTPVQLVVRSPRGGVLKFEAESLAVWDAGGK